MTMVKPDVRADAVDQAHRLARARALTRGREEETLGRLEGDRPWAARARAWRTRSALGSRLALIYRVVFEDPSGATVESRLIAIAIELVAFALRAGHVAARRQRGGHEDRQQDSGNSTGHAAPGATVPAEPPETNGGHFGGECIISMGADGGRSDRCSCTMYHRSPRF